MRGIIVTSAATIREFGERRGESLLMRIAFVINDRLCPAGIVGDVVAEHGHEIVEYYPHEGEPLPPTTPEDWDGLVVLGGKMNAYEDETYPALANIARLVGNAHKSGLPYLGICLGAQLLARALGEGQVQMNSFELGFQPSVHTLRGRSDPLLEGLEIPPVMQMHGDSFSVPPGGELLLTDEMSVVQAIRVGCTSYGFQCHFEVTETDLTLWLNIVANRYGHMLDPEQARILRETRDNSESWLPAAQAFGTEVTRRWLGLAERSAVAA